mgnify:CR=1 FL=1
MSGMETCMIRGIGTSKGIGIGHALIIDEPQIEAKTEIVSDTAAELRRYENVKKEDLTYDTEKDDSKDNEKEVITQVYFADSTKNDINYKKILQGFRKPAAWFTVLRLIIAALFLQKAKISRWPWNF